MTIYYSPNTLGFYDTGIVEYSVLPDDIIEISEDDRSRYINEINNNGNQLVLENGKLVLTPKPKIITWETIRLERNNLLDASDYTQIPDFSGNSQLWAAYRQQLRDIPQTYANPEDVIWPVKPNS